MCKHNHMVLYMYNFTCLCISAYIMHHSTLERSRPRNVNRVLCYFEDGCCQILVCKRVVQWHACTPGFRKPGFCYRGVDVVQWQIYAVQWQISRPISNTCCPMANPCIDLPLEKNQPRIAKNSVSARRSATLSSKVSVSLAFYFRTRCGAQLVTLRANFGTNESRALHSVVDCLASLLLISLDT